jgi:outer membrane protein assembly factor BamB
VGPSSPVVKWSYLTGDVVASSAAVGADGTVYVGSDDKNLYAFNPDGTVKWTYAATALVNSSPAIGSDGTVYVGSYDSYLYAVNSDGSLRWKYATGSGVYSSPAIATDGTVYVGSHDGKLHAINPDGTSKWTFNGGHWVNSSPAIGNDGTIYVGCSNGNLYALNPNGSLKWSYTAESDIHSSPAIGADGTIYVGCDGTKLYAINPNGTLKWTFSATDRVHSSPAIGLDGTIYIGSFDHNIYAVNPDGSLKWSYPTGDIIQYCSAIIGADGTVYIGSRDGKLYAMNPDGTLKWSYTTGGPITSSAAIGSDGTLYVGSYDFKLYAISGCGPDPTPPSVPVVSDDGDYTTNGTQLHAIWSSSDPESGIAEYQYAIGTASGGTDVVGWTSAGTNTEVTRTSLNLTPQTTYYFAVRARSGLCYLSTVGTSNGIVFYPVPDADFLADKNVAVVGQSIQFTDSSIGTVTSWHWDFGDGGTDNVTNAVHSYSSAGTYTVSLTVSNPAATNTETKTNYITIYPAPQADFLVSSVRSTEGQIIVFFINTSSGGVPPLTYAWDFENDGTIDGTEREPWHFYSTSGTYTVRLIVTDSAGNTQVKVRPNCLTIFSSDGGTAETADGQVSADFPSGAVAGTAMVTIGTRTASGLPDVSLPFAIGDTCFVITALDDSGNEIVSLSQPSVITAKYSEADLAAAGGDSKNLVLAYWDEAAGRWKVLKTTVDTASMTLSASTTHLSTWAVLAKTASASNGLPLWSWVAMGLAAVLAVGTGTYLVVKRATKH